MVDPGDGSERQADDAGVQVTTAFATNCHNVERMLLVKEPVSPET